MEPAPSRAALERRVIAAVETGKTLAWLEGQPGFPSRRTVWRWSRESPAFAEALARARDWRRGLIVGAKAGPCFHDAQAQALLEAVGRGETLGALLRRPEFPNRRTLNRWKAERPDFAQALAAAADGPRRLRGTRWRAYDEPTADRIVVRLSAGAELRQVTAEPGMPGGWVLARWRKADPGFDHAVRMALKAGRRRRMAGRTALTPKLAAEICRRVAGGATLEALGRQADMPHRVTLQAWMRRDPAFAQRVAAAQRARDEPLADAAVAIAAAATPETLDEARAQLAEIRRTLGARRGERRA